jgi:ppGpp synthetase/RelA/SpoT-type nucleotidyltranferase
VNASELASKDRTRIAAAVKLFDENRGNFEWLAENVFTLLSKHPTLRPLIHSMKWRIKGLEDLRHKLVRKTLQAEQAAKDNKPVAEPITTVNVFDRIEDLAGVRILHIKTEQFVPINAAVLDILAAQKWVVTGPVANTWDDEFRDFFHKIGIETVSRESLYTSVHYVLRANPESPFKCELQVRTLAEEIWGEVSHSVNYPDETPSIACREQLKALARVTSACMRLVDSIFESEKEYKTALTPKRRARKSR